MLRSLLRRSSFVYQRSGRGGAVGAFHGIDLLGRRWGFDRSTVYVREEKYLDRWILYVNGWTLRLHKFWRGDDDRASHTHPWWFVTFPLAEYVEKRYANGVYLGTHLVRAFQPHYRGPRFEHYVVGSWLSYIDPTTHYLPFYTIVLTGPYQQSWGFWPFNEPGVYVPWRDYT